MRSALVAWGRTPPPELHSIVSDGINSPRRIVTWADVMNTRRERQRDRMNDIRYSAGRRVFRVWVAYFDMELFGGWHAFIDRGERQHGEWIDRDRSWLKPILLKTFPLLLPLGSESEQWAAWKVEFANRYQRGKHDKRPRGCHFVWWDGQCSIVPIDATREGD